MKMVKMPNHSTLVRIFPGSSCLQPKDIFVPKAFGVLAEDSSGMSLCVKMINDQLHALIVDGALHRCRPRDYWGYQNFAPEDIRTHFPQVAVDDEYIYTPLFYAKLRRVNKLILFSDLSERNCDYPGRGCILTYFDALARAATQSGYAYIGGYHLHDVIAAHFISSLDFYLIEEMRPGLQGRFDGNPVFARRRIKDVYHTTRFARSSDAAAQTRPGVDDEDAESRLAYRESVHLLLRAFEKVRRMLACGGDTGERYPGILAQIVSFAGVIERHLPSDYRINAMDILEAHEDLLSALVNIVRKVLGYGDVLETAKASSIDSTLSRTLRKMRTQ